MKHLSKNDVENFGRKVFLENSVEKYVGRAEWENCVKGKGEKYGWTLCGKSGLQHYFEKLSRQIWQVSCVEKLYGTI